MRLDQPAEWLTAHGVSFDLIPTLKDRVSALIATGQQADERVTQIDALLLSCQMKHPGKNGAALAACRDQIDDDERPVLELLADGREQAACDLKRRQLIGRLLEQVGARGRRRRHLTVADTVYA